MNTKTISKMVLTAGLVLCSGLLTACETVCDEACDKLDDCGVMSTGGASCSCDSDLEECVAECVLDASCEEIEANDPDSPYTQCMKSCLLGG